MNPLGRRSDPVAASPRRAELGLLLLVLIWAVNFSVIKIGLASIPPYGFNALRFPLAALLLAVVLLKGGRLTLPDPGDRTRILVLGVIGNFLYQLLFISGLARSRAGNASVILNLSPVFIAAGTAWLGHERIRPVAWAGIAVAIVGITLVVGSGEAGLGFGTDTLVGDLLMIGASLVWAVYTVGVRDLVLKYGAVFVTSWTLWAGAVLLLLVGIPDLAGLGADVRPVAWWSVAYAGFLGLGVSYLLWYRGVQALGNTRTAAMGNLVPLLTIAIAWPMLGEVPNVWQVTGALVVIAGVTLVRRAAAPGPMPPGADAERPRG
jgi:drug/metabolite transporter (DMT)-like permease